MNPFLRYLPICTLALSGVVGCGSGPSPTPSSTEAPTEAPAAEEPPDPRVEEPAGPLEMSRSEAIQTAERFVRDQGYTEEASPEGIPVQLEALEDPNSALELRRGTLAPRAAGAVPNEGGFTVFFVRDDSSTRQSGRAVQVRRGEDPEMEHQGIVLPPAPTPLGLTARFVRFLHDTPHCGTLHVAGVAEYEVVSVQRGTYTDERIMVVHGCPELARSRYESEAGNVEAFVAGDVHELSLSVHVPIVTGGISPMDTPEHPELHRYWATTTNQSSSE